MVVLRRLLIFVLLVGSHSMASNTTCNSDPPIDSAAKAWCVVSDFLAYQSCASAFGFGREAVEREDRWKLTIRDHNPAQGEGCRTLYVAVCKDTGEILYSPDTDHCDAGSIEH